MVFKKVFTYLVLIICVISFSTGCFQRPLKEKNVEIDTAQADKEKIKQSSPKPISTVEKKYDLYSAIPYEIPLYSVFEISKLPNDIKVIIDNLLESSLGFYLLRNDGEKIFIILQNSIDFSDTYQRHGLQFVEIDYDGKVRVHNAGYTGIQGETANLVDDKKQDMWVFDETFEPIRPLKHVVYDENKKIKFTEVWNYDEKESIKYQMYDSHKKVVSILKESQDNESNLRKEHIFYDNNGNILMSLTVNYDGANVSRVNFYNSHDKIDSMSLFTEYTDGFKTKECVYDENYKLINTVVADYTDGERTTIKVFDSEGKEIGKIAS